MTTKEEDIVSFLKNKYPTAKTTLLFHNAFECLVAISLSAQTTDKSVNKVTSILFDKYPGSKEMSLADVHNVEEIIKSLGLYRNKAKNIVDLSKTLEEKYHGNIPQDRKELTKLPGIGNKTAGVFLLEIGAEAYFPVDTHIKRIATRLGYADEDWNPARIEKKLEKIFPRDEWIHLHHAFIFFGRDFCKAKNPLCFNCRLGKYCSYLKKHSSITGK